VVFGPLLEQGSGVRCRPNRVDRFGVTLFERRAADLYTALVNKLPYLAVPIVSTL
jgi:hypothetical protein